MTTFDPLANSLLSQSRSAIGHQLSTYLKLGPEARTSTVLHCFSSEGSKALSCRQARPLLFSGRK
jgi:hypothetical protein